MISSRDAQIIKLWVENHPNPNTRYCYWFDSERLLNCAKKPLSRITLADLQAFAESLSDAGLAPVSRVRVLAATKSLFGFCYRMHHIPVNPAAELALPRYEIPSPSGFWTRPTYTGCLLRNSHHVTEFSYTFFTLAVCASERRLPCAGATFARTE
jgi:hypothetical protein